MVPIIILIKIFLKVTTEIGGETEIDEEATRMELEEKLYDRLTVTIAQLQVIPYLIF